MSHARDVEYVSPDLLSGGIHGSRAAIGDMLKSAGDSSGGPKRQSGQTSLLSYAKPTGYLLAACNAHTLQQFEFAVFAQPELPPVPDKQRETKFLFECKRFSACVPTSYNLTTAFRQSDPTFLTVADELRMGQLSSSSVAFLRGLERTPPGGAGTEPSVIYSRREEVDRGNGQRMREIRADEREFAATDSGDQANITKLQSSCIAPSTLKLKQDSLEMIIKNKNQTLVNRALGKVVGFMEDSGLPIVRWYAGDMELEQEEWTLEQNGQVVARRRQIPLALAWTTSVHKAQGQTLDRLKVDRRSVFEKGRANVSLSRATSLDSLQMLNFDPKKVQCHPKVVAWHKKMFGE